MSSSHKLVRLFSAVVLLLGLAVPVMAQDVPKVDLSGGYNLLRFTDETLPGGWYADVAGNLSEMIGLVGQVDGNYKTFGFSGLSVDTKIHGFMGGVRVNSRRNAKAVPFGQVLFGGVRTSGSSNLSGVLPFSVGESETDAALQVGGGVNVMPAGNVGLRVGADYIRMFTPDQGTNVFRFSAGVVLPFGK